MRQEWIEAIRAHEGIDNAILDYLCAEEDRYIFGDGAQAATCLGFFREMGVPVRGLLLPPGAEPSRLKGYWGRMIRTAERIGLDRLDPEERAVSPVLIATDRGQYPAALALLREKGYSRLYTCCWERNQYLRDICWRIYIKK